MFVPILKIKCKMNCNSKLQYSDFARKDKVKICFYKCETQFVH